MKRICRYLQGNKDNVLVFNPYKKLVVDCYADADFAGLWGHEEDLIYPLLLTRVPGLHITPRHHTR